LSKELDKLELIEEKCGRGPHFFPDNFTFEELLDMPELFSFFTG